MSFVTHSSLRMQEDRAMHGCSAAFKASWLSRKLSTSVFPVVCSLCSSLKHKLERTDEYGEEGGLKDLTSKCRARIETQAVWSPPAVVLQTHQARQFSV